VTTPRRRRVGAAAFLGALASLLYAAPAPAHEIGTTRVSVLFHQEESTYEIELVTDAAALVEKLEAAALSEPLSLRQSESARRAEGPARFDGTFRRRVRIAFDGAQVRPEIAYSVTPAQDAANPAVATIRLRGPIPATGRQFTWTYGWTFASYAMTLRRSPSGQPVTEWLEGGQSSAPWPWASTAPTPDRGGTALRYLALGFTHIVPLGLDHVLFILGIYLLSGRRRSVLWQVSAFTAAHSITLGLSLYGIATVPSRIVEPMIAASIAYVAIENIFRRELNPWRVALVFAFGLLHGLGFAGALREVGLPRAELLTALVTFNLGVEAGQLAVIGAAFVLLGWRCADRVWYRSRIVVPASVAIACTAIYWTIARLA
jgi:hydrogenase/urease accessory protein HupE